MVTTYHHHNQAKMEAFDALSTLHQYDSPEKSMVVVRRSPTLPISPVGPPISPTWTWGTSSAQFPLDWLHLCRLLPFSDTEVVCPQEEGEMGLNMFPYFQEALWQSSEEEYHLSNLISLLVPSLAPHPHQEEGNLMEGGLGFHPALKLLQDVNQARGHLECDLDQETQQVAQRYNDRWIKLARRHEKW